MESPESKSAPRPVSFLKMSGDGGLLFSFPEPKHCLNIFDFFDPIGNSRLFVTFEPSFSSFTGAIAADRMKNRPNYLKIQTKLWLYTRPRHTLIHLFGSHFGDDDFGPRKSSPRREVPNGTVAMLSAARCSSALHLARQRSAL